MHPAKGKSTRQGTTRSTEFLAKLQRIHGHNSISTDVFGRRQALPSEVARQLKLQKKDRR
jgi:hypothetical protein